MGHHLFKRQLHIPLQHTSLPPSHRPPFIFVPKCILAHCPPHSLARINATPDDVPEAETATTVANAPHTTCAFQASTSMTHRRPLHLHLVRRLFGDILGWMDDLGVLNAGKLVHVTACCPGLRPIVARERGAAHRAGLRDGGAQARAGGAPESWERGRGCGNSKHSKQARDEEQLHCTG